MEGTPFGRYRLVALLGRGGMGEVWRAFDTAMNRVVALKLLPASLADDEQYQARFRREAQVAAGLDEPHIVPIHDFGEIDGRLYVTMRLIDGKTVNELLVNGPLAPERAVSIVEQIGAALNAAHRVGLVHRDVKPSNILVTEDDFAYLIDFGIARAAGATKLTSTGTTIGTFAYMAPERFTSDRADAPAADVYALTCVLYECLTGSQPFPGDSMERQITSHLTVPPPRPSAMQPGVSPQLDQVIAVGMAKDPGHRYATTRDLAVAARAGIAGMLPQHQQGPAFNWAPPTPGWSVPVAYPNTAPNAPSASAPTQYSTPAGPAPMPPIPAWDTQSGQTGRPWWRNPALLILATGLAVVVVVVIVATVLLIGSQGDSSNADRTANASERSHPSAPSARPSAPSTHRAAPVPTSSAPTEPTELLTADGLTDLLANMRNRFGNTMGFQLTVFTDYAVTSHPDPNNIHIDQSFTYRNGNWAGFGPDMTTSPLDNLADLGAFNTGAVAATLAGAASVLQAPDNTKTYLIVDGDEGGGLNMSIHSTAPGTGFMQINPDGSVKKVFPP